jgi:SWI/SNF-related matrix-associated actin-dependent regulator of chromatin subfamily A member 5
MKGSAPPKVSLEDLQRQLPAEQRKIRNERMAKMKVIKDAMDGKKAIIAEKSAQGRLEYLMAQAEMFTHFSREAPLPSSAIETSSSSSASAAAAGGGGGSSELTQAKPRGRRSKVDKEETDLVDDSVSPAIANSKLLAQPSLIKGQMRDYQLEGLNWMLNLHDNNISGILADEMGLGKTIQAISLLAALKEFRGVTGPHLVLAPKSVVGNWYREFTKFCPSFRVLKMLGQDKVEREKLIKEELLGEKPYDVIVTSYDTFVIEKSAFKRFAWYYIIIDEAHRIKNEKSILAMEVRKQASFYRLLLTGTPLQNNLHELWALLNFLLPDVFSSSDDFDSWFAQGGSSEVVKKLHSVIKPFLLRRLKIDVEHSLLPKIETKLYVGMTAMQRKWYKSLLSKDAISINELGADRVRLLNIVMQLRKACNHPYLFDGAEEGPPFDDFGPHIYENCGKMQLLHKLLPKLKSQGSRVLIFSQMTRMLNIIEDYLRIQGTQYCRIDGNTGSLERESAMDAFNAPGSPIDVFLLSTRAGGLGINLYTADIVILYDSDWNPQADLQAMDRAHRIGQKKQVRVFRFVTESSVEEKIVERAERKLFLDAVIVQQGRLAPQDKALSKEALLDMVRFGADDIFRGVGATYTDEDIDVILSRSEKKTKEEAGKLQREMAQTLGNLNMEDLLKGAAFTTAKSKTDSSLPFFIPVAEREAKIKSRAHDVPVLEKVQKQNLPKLLKPPQMNDFQFFNRRRIEEIYAIENDLILKRKEVTNSYKEEVAREKIELKNYCVKRSLQIYAENRQSHAGSNASASSAAMEVDELAKEIDKDIEEVAAGPTGGNSSYSHCCALAKAEYKAMNVQPVTTQFEKAMEELQLPAEVKEEKERLESEGFKDWSRKDYKALTSALERHGRNNKEVVLAEVMEVTEKDFADVSRYYDIFMERGPSEISEFKAIEKKMKAAESGILDRDKNERIIAERVARTPDPMRTLKIPYPQSKVATSKGYTEEEDRFLILLMNSLGYGAWDEMRAEIRRSESFRFDFFLKSRTPLELSKRCDALVRMLEKDAIENKTPAGKIAAEAELRKKEDREKAKEKEKDRKVLAISASSSSSSAAASSSAAGAPTAIDSKDSASGVMTGHTTEGPSAKKRKVQSSSSSAAAGAPVQSFTIVSDDEGN